MRPSRTEKSGGAGGDQGASGGRWNYLYAMWDEALTLDPLPQFDRWVAARMKERRQFGRRDRAWYSERLFGAVRWGAWALLVDWAARERETAGGTAAAAADKRDGLDWAALVARFAAAHPDFTAVREAWRRMGAPALLGWLEWRRSAEGVPDSETPDAGAAPSPAGIAAAASLRAAAARTGAPMSVRGAAAGVPPWWAGDIERRAAESRWSEDDTRQFFARLASRPPLWLRVHREGDLAGVRRALRAGGFEIIAEDGLALAARGPRGIFDLEFYKTGRAAIQDWASQQAGRRVEARPGEMIWDACAGGGGKTLQLAAALDNRGAVYASDVREQALEETRRRARGAGFHNVRTLAWDGRTLPEFGREVALRGGFDRVLVDAPCSSAGVWRRNPDAMFRHRPEDARRLAAEQLEILMAAAGAVRPGGRLIYATCSWTVEEDEDVVRNFLARREAAGKTFSLISSELLGSPAADSDTMFAAAMKKGE